jgi:hypothetical protein
MLSQIWLKNIKAAMKRISFLFCIFLLGTTAVAQVRSATATMVMPVPMPPALELDIREQPDSPLQLTIDRKAAGRLPGSPLTLRNVGTSTIVALVLRVDVEPYGFNQLVFLGTKGLGIGESRMHGLAAPRTSPDGATEKPAASVDFVRFADGRTWGDDSLGRSKDIAAYIEGRSLAMSRLNELLIGRDDTDFKRAFEVFGSSSFSEPNLPPGRPLRSMDWKSRGYEEVLNILRRMPRNTDLAKDLARQIEVMSAPENH